ncbi:MAG: MFS transporter [Holosporaceae bacterium]|nr:MAG: MFS transporter [Holosporaceae bacterium]
MTKEILLHFQITATDFGILTSLYYLGYAVMQVPIGAFLDRYGPRYIASSFVLLCALGAILFAFATNWTIALIARFMIGVGSSGAYISSKHKGDSILGA